MEDVGQYWNCMSCFSRMALSYLENKTTPLSGWDQFKTPYTWNYHIWTKSQQEQVISFAYPDDRRLN